MSEILKSPILIGALYTVLIYYLFKKMMAKRKLQKNFIKKVDAKEFNEIKGKQQLIDVRSKDQFKVKRIHGARNIPMTSINSAENKLFKDKTVFLYCNSGKTAVKASKKLLKQGFADIVVMKDNLDNYPGKFN